MPADGLALGDGAGLDAPGPGDALVPTDGVALGVAAVEGETGAVGLGDADGLGVGLVVGLAGLLAGAAGAFPEPPLPPSGNADCFVEAPTAVSTPIAIAKTKTARPATASQRRRRVGSPRRRLLQRSRLQPEGVSASIASDACPAGSPPGNGSSGSCTVGGGSSPRAGRVATPLDQSVRRAATAMRRSRSLVLRSDARYRVEPTDATTLAMAAPIRVPATPKVEEMTAADIAASALAATWVKLGLAERGEEPDVEATMIGVELLLF